MRFILKFKLPVDIGNDLIKNGQLGLKLQKIIDEQKPEAVYFTLEDGVRTALVIQQMDKPSDLPKIAEPWFLAFEAHMEAAPAMLPEDLKNAGPAMEAAAKAYG